MTLSIYLMLQSPNWLGRLYANPTKKKNADIRAPKIGFRAPFA
jgi:hypothetical protein